MKKFNVYSLWAIALTLFISSCNEKIPDLYPSEQVKGAYIINFGNFGEGGSSVDKYNYDTDVLTSNYFYQQNEGLELLANIQHASVYGDSIYLLTNNSDQLITVNPLFKQSLNGFTHEKLANPRFCIADGDYLYISCLGSNPDWSEMPDTYVLKMNRMNKTIEASYPVPGGPEGLAIVNNQLYVALNYKDSIAVIDLNSASISYIATPAVSSYFIKDPQNNLYATQVSTWSDYSEETGLAYINTSSTKYEKTFKLNGISADYGSIIAANNDFTSIYVMASEYDETWNLSGTVFKFDVASGNYTAFITNISGPTGVCVNPVNDDVYLLTSSSV
ncbi:MAG: hypothetical protein JXR22_11615, partial [Prolixibacteraceae bacterium]|nr:hypothetical protein [Prolixibacteraceae bacterium]